MSVERRKKEREPKSVLTMVIHKRLDHFEVFNSYDENRRILLQTISACAVAYSLIMTTTSNNRKPYYRVFNNNQFFHGEASTSGAHARKGWGDLSHSMNERWGG